MKEWLGGEYQGRLNGIWFKEPLTFGKVTSFRWNQRPPRSRNFDPKGAPDPDPLPADKPRKRFDAAAGAFAAAIIGFSTLLVGEITHWIITKTDSWLGLPTKLAALEFYRMIHGSLIIASALFFAAAVVFFLMYMFSVSIETRK